MVAYSFQKRFAEPIVLGTKGGTIRLPRKRDPRPGEELQLYTGMRTKQCRLIERRRCLEVEAICLDFIKDEITIGGRTLVPPWHLNTFARFDGFADFAEMASFWEKHALFTGVHIRWLPLPAFSQVELERA